jgi:hypothetical protein
MTSKVNITLFGEIKQAGDVILSILVTTLT